jgi:predicted GIY-YIG superfamily endonuclease
MRENDNHYVYLYRNAEGKVLYVGYGATHRRATIHSSRSHGETLGTFLKRSKFTLEIAGPFRSKITGSAVETALISVLKPRFNKHSGSTDCRFRPFGLPNRFADRLDLPPLNAADFFRGTERAAAVLFVYVGDEDFDDGRPGYNPVNPPKNRQIINRMNRWWQVGRYLEGWRKNPSQSPFLLIGLTGRPKDRFIIGAVRVKQHKWGSVEKRGGLYSIPTSGPRDLDAFASGAKNRPGSEPQIRRPRIAILYYSQT